MLIGNKNITLIGSNDQSDRNERPYCDLAKSLHFRRIHEIRLSPQRLVGTMVMRGFELVVLDKFPCYTAAPCAGMGPLRGKYHELLTSGP